MKILLTSGEVAEAVDDYIRKGNLVKTTQPVTVRMMDTRERKKWQGEFVMVVDVEDQCGGSA